MNDLEIRFGGNSLSLDDYGEFYWYSGEFKNVFFYGDMFVRVLLLNSEDDSLYSSLNSICDGKPLAIDLEWKPDLNGENNMISIFQFCSSNSVVIVQNESEIGSMDLFRFLRENKFVGKGVHNDNKKLEKMFNCRFEIEDIEVSKLRPHGLPLNFSKLVEELVGTPNAQFKDVSMSKSDWTRRPLSIQQVLYASFDAYSIYICNKIIEEKFNENGFIVCESHYRKSKKEKEINKNKKIPCRKSPKPPIGSHVTISNK